MYCNGNVAGTGGRKINYANVAGAGGNRRCNCGCNCGCNNVSPDYGRNCNFVYNCLLELLENAIEEDNCERNCDFVYDCLDDLLESAGDNNNCDC